jgi:hypothetical protein
MSNPTTPFSWQMPTATDLVTDLPADFEVFGQAVATSMADLLGGTTGQVLSKTSNTDMDFTWIANDQGDITGVTAGVGISGGGTSGTVTVTNSMATAITTAGDTLYGTGSGTFSRLGIGTAGQVLTVNGGATAPSWATPASGGGQTLLSTTTLSGATTTVSIAGGYKDLKVVVFGCTNATGGGRFRIAPNGTINIVYQTGTANANTTSVYNNYIQAGYIQTFDNPLESSAVNVYQLEIFDYTSTTARKNHRFTNMYTAGGSTINTENWGGGINTTSAITSLVFSNAGGNYSAGTVLVYGVS